MAQSVTRGQRIASVGNTGNSLSPHLHMQIQDRPSLATDDPEVRTFSMVFEHTTLTRGVASRRRPPPTSGEVTSSAPTANPATDPPAPVVARKRGRRPPAAE